MSNSINNNYTMRWGEFCKAPQNRKSSGEGNQTGKKNLIGISIFYGTTAAMRSLVHGKQNFRAMQYLSRGQAGIQFFSSL